jgi:hypothetical protein
MVISDGETLICAVIFFQVILMTFLFFILLGKLSDIALIANENRSSLLERALICKRVESSTKIIAENSDKAIAREPAPKREPI